MKTSIGFSIYINSKFDRKMEFDRPIINIGKLSTSNLRLEDINVSRKHAVIEQLESGAWRVTDLGSTNGTVLHGERVVQAEVKDGDRITLGTTTLLVHLNEATASKPKPASGGSAAAAAADSPDSNKGKGKQAPATKGKKTKKGAAASGPGRPEEIRGLGQESFYKKKQQAQQRGERLALEVALLWGDTILSTRTFLKAEDVTIGEHKNSHFAMPSEELGRDSFKLVVGHGGNFALNLDRCGLEGDVLIEDKVQSLEELRQDPRTKQKLFPIDKPLRARLKAGAFTMLVSYGPVPPKPVGPRLHESDYMAITCIIIAAIVHLSFLGVLAWLPEDLRMSTRDPRLRKERALQVLRVEPDKDEEKEEPPKDEDDPNAKKRYSKDAKDTKLKVSATEVKVDQPVNQRLKLVDKLNLQKRKDRENLANLSADDRAKKVKEMAQMTAMNEAFNQNNSALSDLLDTNPELDNKPSQFKALTSKGGDNPAVASSGAVDPFGGTLMPGSGGFQAVGGPSGGPSGGPAISGVLGKRRGGRDLNDLKFDERPADPKIIQLKPRLTGELDPKTVQAYIRRYLSGIKWCYQDRLQQNRRLKGKLTLAFTILPNGKVLDPHTKNSSVKDQVLEACIVKKMSRWRFPQPKDGGVVEVSYPLILKTQ